MNKLAVSFFTKFFIALVILGPCCASSAQALAQNLAQLNKKIESLQYGNIGDQRLLIPQDPNGPINELKDYFRCTSFEEDLKNISAQQDQINFLAQRLFWSHLSQNSYTVQQKSSGNTARLSLGIEHEKVRQECIRVLALKYGILKAVAAQLDTLMQTIPVS